MKVPLIISYKDYEPVNLYNVDSLNFKKNIIIFYFTRRDVEWIFEDEKEAKMIYDIILERYVHFLEKE